MLALVLNLFALTMQDIDLISGIDHVENFTLDAGDKIDIADSSLLTLKINSNLGTLTFRSLSKIKGKTSAFIRDTNGNIKIAYKVNVSPNGKMNTVLELRELLSSVEGISINLVGGKILISGQLLLPDDIGKVVDLATRFDPDIINHVEYSPHALSNIAQKMVKELKDKGLQEANVRVVNKNFWIEGSVKSPQEKDLAFEIVKPMLPAKIDPVADASSRLRLPASKENIYNFLVVNEEERTDPPAKMIKIAVQFVEMTQDYRKVFAFKWAPAFTEDTKTGFSVGTNSVLSTSSDTGLNFTGYISNLFPKLNIAKVAGFTKDIQSGMVMVKENVSAEIKKNMDQNYQIGSDRWAQPAKTSIGFSFSATPKILSGENVELEKLNIRMLTPTIPGVQGTPQSIESSVSTHLVIKSKMSAVIGGMVRHNISKQFDRDDPYGSQSGGTNQQGISTSPLFNFMKSRRLDYDKNQFAIFVTPEILEFSSQGVEEVAKKFKDKGE